MRNRIHHAVLVLIGRCPAQFSTERLELFMALEKTNAALADLKTAIANALAAKDATIAQLQQEVADADAAIAADIEATAAQIAPAPAADPAQPSA